MCRVQRETLFRRALEEELELQRVCLSYEELEVEEDALNTWQLILSRPAARIDHNILRAGVRQSVPKEIRGAIWHLLVSQDCNRLLCALLLLLMICRNYLKFNNNNNNIP